MSKSVRHVVYLGILFALAITLSWAESLIPPLPFPVSYTHLDVYKRQALWFATKI